MKHRNKAYRQWVISDMKTLTKLWESKTLQEIANELDKSVAAIHSLAKKMRDNGIDLPKKRRIGYMDNLLAEFKKTLTR